MHGVVRLKKTPVVTRFCRFPHRTSRWTRGCCVLSITNIWHSTDLTRNWFYVLQKHLRAIEKDRKPYTLEVDEVKVQESILKRDLSKSESSRLSRQLSKRYPGLPITQALRNENEMLRQELQRMRVGLQPHILEVQLVTLISLCFGVDGMSTSIFIASNSTSKFTECTEAIDVRGLITSNLPTQEWDGCWEQSRAFLWRQMQISFLRNRSFYCVLQACLDYDHQHVIEQLIELTENEPLKLEKAASKRWWALRNDGPLFASATSSLVTNSKFLNSASIFKWGSHFSQNMVMK